MSEPGRTLPAYDKLTDVDLARACAEEPINQDAWEAFYGRFFRGVSYVVRHLLLDRPADVPDLVQECFFRIFRVLRLYDPARSSLKTFISRISRNRVLDYIKKGYNLRSASVSLEEEMEKVQIHAEQDPAFLAIMVEHVAVKTLREPMAEVARQIMLHKTAAQIQRSTGVSRDTVTEMRAWVIERIQDVAYLLPDG